jgi:nitrate reductase delta subunit
VTEIYDRLANLLEYPRERPELSGAGPLLAGFAQDIQALSLEQIQELYVHTFELSPVCSLEIGWHLFGEAYERGEFLVKMRQELRRYGVPESSELPDHLTYVLRLVSRMEPEEATKFISAFLLPALEKMRAGLEGKNNPYEKVLAAIDSVLKTLRSNAVLEVIHD